MRTKYRILKHGGYYFVQERFLFLWRDVNEYGFRSLDAAERFIKILKETESSRVVGYY